MRRAVTRDPTFLVSSATVTPPGLRRGGARAASSSSSSFSVRALPVWFVSLDDAVIIPSIANKDSPAYIRRFHHPKPVGVLGLQLPGWSGYNSNWKIIISFHVNMIVTSNCYLGQSITCIVHNQAGC